MISPYLLLISIFNKIKICSLLIDRLHERSFYFEGLLLHAFTVTLRIRTTRKRTWRLSAINKLGYLPGSSHILLFVLRSRRLLQTVLFKPVANMAAALRMKTWRCPTRGVFSLLAVFFLILVNTVKEATAAPETGLWKVTVVNVSIILETLWRPAASLASDSYISLVIVAR